MVHEVDWLVKDGKLAPKLNGEDFSKSARRHACEQYARPSVCLSQARQYW